MTISTEEMIFYAFAEANGELIDLDSIKICDPPEPDILCKLKTGEIVYFELTECVTPEVPRELYTKLKVHKLFEKNLESHPLGEIIIKMYPAKMIHVGFRDGLTISQIRATIPQIFKFLSKSDPTKSVLNFYHPFEFPPLQNIAGDIEIYSYNGELPEFRIDKMIEAIPSNILVPEAVRAKYRKSYETGGRRVYLLAFFLHQFEHFYDGGEEFLHSLEDEMIKMGDFTGLYVYSWVNKRNIYPIT